MSYDRSLGIVLSKPLSCVSATIRRIEDGSQPYAFLKYNLEKEGFTLVGSQTRSGPVELRRKSAEIPILLLAGRASQTDGIAALEAGADD